jgi:DNA-binding XRE family transcriptional regulator
MSAIRIRVLGVKADLARAWLQKSVPTAQVVEEREHAEYVLLTPDDLDDLLDDAAAVAAYQHTREEETVPAAMTRRLIAGESPIKVWREHRGLTLDALAQRTENSKGYLSQLENRERSGTVATLKKIAAALNVDLDELV